MYFKKPQEHRIAVVMLLLAAMFCCFEQFLKNSGPEYTGTKQHVYYDLRLSF